MTSHHDENPNRGKLDYYVGVNSKARMRAFQEDLLKMSDTSFIRRARRHCIQNSLEYASGEDWVVFCDL